MDTSLLIKCAATMGVSMIPVLELRAAIPFGLALGLSPLLTYIVSVLGNLIPAPFIMLLLRSVFRWLRRWPWWEKRINSIEQHAHDKGQVVRKYSLPGLLLLVAVPLPGTGAWTGALVATILKIRLRTAIPIIFLGLLIAGAITLGVSLGVIHLWS